MIECVGQVTADPLYSQIERDLDVVELWSGVGTVFVAALKKGYAAKPFDILRDPLVTHRSEDIASHPTKCCEPKNIGQLNSAAGSAHLTLHAATKLRVAFTFGSEVRSGSRTH